MYDAYLGHDLFGNGSERGSEEYIPVALLEIWCVCVCGDFGAFTSNAVTSVGAVTWNAVTSVGILVSSLGSQPLLSLISDVLLMNQMNLRRRRNPLQIR